MISESQARSLSLAGVRGRHIRAQHSLHSLQSSSQPRPTFRLAPTRRSRRDYLTSWRSIYQAVRIAALLAPSRRRNLLLALLVFAVFVPSSSRWDESDPLQPEYDDSSTALTPTALLATPGVEFVRKGAVSDIHPYRCLCSRTLSATSLTQELRSNI